MADRKKRCERLDPIFKTLAPGKGDIPRTPGREKLGGTAEEGYIHCGPSGSGHFVKMVHNGIEYGIMQAYAEGFDIFKNATSKELPEDIRYDLNLPDIAEVWRRGSVVSSWLLDLTAMALTENPTLSEYEGYRAGFRRRALDDSGGARRSGAGGCADRGVVSCASGRGSSTRSRRRCFPPCGRSSADTSKRGASQER